MGLRFRKSISLCKGVKLNFGKTGMSVSLGTKGYHKTINTSGSVTTTVGLPGTGIYYTDTKKLGRQNKNENQQNIRQSVDLFGKNRLPENVDLQRYDEFASMNSIYDEVAEYVDIPEVRRSVDVKDNQPVAVGKNEFSELIDIDSEDTPWNYSDSEAAGLSGGNVNTSARISLSEKDIKNIYRCCDATIEWTEIIGGATAEELLMDLNVWMFCKEVALEILNGNIDAYLKAIETLKPVDDLLLYSGDFEFGTDKPNYIEVEFSHNAKELLEGGADNQNYEDLIYAISTRVSRDLLALLPINKVIVHVVEDNITVMFGIYDRATLNKYSNIEIRELISMFKHSVNIIDGRMMAVTRLSIN